MVTQIESVYRTANVHFNAPATHVAIRTALSLCGSGRTTGQEDGSQKAPSSSTRCQMVVKMKAERCECVRGLRATLSLANAGLCPPPFPSARRGRGRVHVVGHCCAVRPPLPHAEADDSSSMRGVTPYIRLPGTGGIAIGSVRCGRVLDGSLGMAGHSVNDAFALKNANIITVSADCFRFSEVLLQPSFIGTETSGSHDAFFQSVMRHDCDTREDVYVDVVRMRVVRCSQRLPR